MLRPHVLAEKARLAKGYDDLQRRHRSGCAGLEVCMLASNLRDDVLCTLVSSALADLKQDGPGGLLDHIALVAHGGYGRRDVAPFSDVDLMILHHPGYATAVAPLAQRLLREVFDVGLILGHSVRTTTQACRLACRDGMICTSLADSRLISGNANLFDGFMHRFRRMARHRAGRLLGAVRAARDEERGRYGETVFLLEPNIKRSRGTLRDLQLLRWVGFIRYGETRFHALHQRGLLADDEIEALERAYEFLLWLRNELHFHAGQGNDVLSRSEQLRLAELQGYEPAAGLLPVERFMQDYFRHTSQVSHIAGRFLTKAASHERLARLSTELFGHRVDRDLRVGPAGMMATRSGLARMRGNLTAVMRLVDLSNLHDVPIATATWEAIRRDVPFLPAELSAEARRHFRSLLAHPARLGTLVRDLHDSAILERFIPDFARARGLLQFNQYHKYTVDEHSLRALEFATALQQDDGPLGRVYRSIAEKDILHLALLLHDLGKGFLEDHREIGLRIAEQVGLRLGLKPAETEVLKFLVHKHLRMNHLAFRRDTSDEDVVIRFAVEVGSPATLKMLYVMTACDLGAVGPGVWDGWKTEVLTDLYHRTMQQLAGDSLATTVDQLFDQRREQIRNHLGPLVDQPWFARHIADLTTGYLSATPAENAADDLRMLKDLQPGQAVAIAQPLADTQSVQFTVGASESMTPGIFHRLTGALTSLGLEIRSAQIHTLADGLVLDRFWVRDPDFSGAPPPRRLEEINAALVESLRPTSDQPPAFRRTWQPTAQRKFTGPRPSARVNADNSTSENYTILDVFALDRTGLLYAVTRTLFELDISVWRAKIGTHLDQVVDAFYVTDAQRRKIDDPERLKEVRRRLLAVIDATEPAAE